jgi:hypothetical protein
MLWRYPLATRGASLEDGLFRVEWHLPTKIGV